MQIYDEEFWQFIKSFLQSKIEGSHLVYDYAADYAIISCCYLAINPGDAVLENEVKKIFQDDLQFMNYELQHLLFYFIFSM